MILVNELEEQAFEYYPDADEWVKGNLKLSIHDGIITFVRENDNYNGLNVWIYSAADLKLFLSFCR